MYSNKHFHRINTVITKSVSIVFQNSLTSANYDTLVSQITNEVTSGLEKNVFKTTFNRVRAELSMIVVLYNIADCTCRDDELNIHWCWLCKRDSELQSVY